MTLPESITIGAKYGPAMNITDQAKADEYFEALVEHSMRCFGQTREEAERLERDNLGYFAGYSGHDTRLRVEQLFHCRHPVFGEAVKGTPTPEDASIAGAAAVKGGAECATS
jgi:hypothetical protein